MTTYSEIQAVVAEEFAAHNNWQADKQSDSKWDQFHHFRGKVQKLHGEQMVEKEGTGDPGQC